MNSLTVEYYILSLFLSLLSLFFPFLFQHCAINVVNMISQFFIEIFHFYSDTFLEIWMIFLYDMYQHSYFSLCIILIFIFAYNLHFNFHATSFL